MKREHVLLLWVLLMILGALILGLLLGLASLILGDLPEPENAFKTALARSRSLPAGGRSGVSGSSLEAFFEGGNDAPLGSSAIDG